MSNGACRRRLQPQAHPSLTSGAHCWLERARSTPLHLFAFLGLLGLDVLGLQSSTLARAWPGWHCVLLPPTARIRIFALARPTHSPCSACPVWAWLPRSALRATTRLGRPPSPPCLAAVAATARSRAAPCGGAPRRATRPGTLAAICPSACTIALKGEAHRSFGACHRHPRGLWAQQGAQKTPWLHLRTPASLCFVAFAQPRQAPPCTHCWVTTQVASARRSTGPWIKTLSA